MNSEARILGTRQDDLISHFCSLAAVREESGFPIFALEHGMNAAELQHISVLLNSRQKAGLRSDPYWLLWAIYASEVGYRYTGDEYWPPFEHQTPNWLFQDRPKVTRWFRKFQESFNGAVPSGPWADHFRIIAWPITHALLPRYLQRQFAKLLYDLRFRLTSASLDAGSIGRLLAAHASHTSTRFQAFLEQEELTGQIVAALLGGQSDDASELIHPPTLNRIVEDLERVRSSREWLKETQRIVLDRFKGIARGEYRSSRPTTPSRSDEPTLPDGSRFAIRPDLLLRHTGDGKWTVLLHLKSLRPIASESTALQVFLNSTRCRLNGGVDWKPSGWLMSGNRRGALRHWPDVDLPLVEFEHASPLMDHLLETEYRLTPGPLWLFRIGSDGIARFIASPIVRPDNEYIVVTAGEVARDIPGLTACTVNCEDIHAFRLAVPSHVSANVEMRLSELGIDVARTIRVWPAGLPGRGWDGDGSTEWLTTESPCFGVASDHPLEKLVFRLNDGMEEFIATEPQGSPTFIQLRPLPAGNHLLTVEAHRIVDLKDAATTSPARGFAKLAVREPEPWVPGVASHPGLIVTPDPFDANLDVLWRNELNLAVTGPKGFTVRIRVKLHTSDGKEVLSELISSSMHLPITADRWRTEFADFLNSEAHAWKYLEAARCTLEINGDSLGRCELQFDHDPSPLRWAMGSRQRRTFVRLVDDSGQHNTAPDIRFFNMKRPLVGETLDAETARAGFNAPPPGGLYIARHSKFEDAAVVSARESQITLQNLGVRPNTHVLTDQNEILEALQLFRLWENARQTGYLATAKRNQVTRSIINAMIKSVCGKNWAKAEKDFASQPEALETLIPVRTSFHGRAGWQGFDGESESTVTARFIAEAKRQGLTRDQDLCHFALGFADGQKDAFNNPHVDDRVSQLLDSPALLRLARLFLLLRKQRRDRQTPGSNNRT